MSDLRTCQECRRALPRHGSDCSFASAPEGTTIIDAPPPVLTDGQLQAANAEPDRFRSPVGLGKFAFFGLVWLFGSLVFSVFTGLRYRAGIIGLIDGTYDGSFQELIDIENAYGYSGWLDIIGVLVMALTWLLWMRRLRANVVALGRQPEYRPAWIFWGWVTPIINYFRPYQVVRDLWRKSDPEPGNGTIVDPPPFYLLWWITFVVTSQLGSSVVRRIQEPETLGEMQSMVNTLLAIDILGLPSLILAVMVIRSLTDRQIRAGAELGKQLA